MYYDFFKNGKMHEIFSNFDSDQDWGKICNLFPEIESLNEVPQDPKFHAEGDVGAHTQLVVNNLVKDSEFMLLSEEDKFLMFWTAVFHDIGKLKRTIQEDDGSITSRGHSKTGASMAREYMRSAGMPFFMREHMCAIIAAHQVPFWLYERETEDQHKKAIKLSLELDPKLLVMHARADARGRICEDKDALLEGVDLCELIFTDIGAFDKSYKFANPESKVSYFSKFDRHPEYEAFEDYSCNVTVMSGLPGSGKDTWIKSNKPELPVVSLDDIRKELKVSPTSNQGVVIQKAYEDAREYLRQKQDFIWNTTNITSEMRSKIIRLLRDYNARISIVYIEVSKEDLLRQNSSRKDVVCEKVIGELVRKLEPPKDWEAHEVVRVITQSANLRKYKAPMNGY